MLNKDYVMQKKEEVLETYDIKSWQAIHVQQLGYIRNLIIILSTALTGFIVSLLFSNEKLAPCVEVLLKISGSGYLIPLSLGILLAIKESKNYRLKYKAARILKRYEGDIENKEFMKLEKECTALEGLNKRLFKGQLVTFLGAFFILIVALLFI